MSRSTVPKPEHGSLEWLRLRHRDSIGYPVVSASESAAVHSEHRFKTKYALGAEKLDAEPVVTEQNRAMERGTRLEPVLLKWVSDEIKRPVVEPVVMYTYATKDASLIATLDGVVGDGELVVKGKYNDGYEEKEGVEGVF